MGKLRGGVRRDSVRLYAIFSKEGGGEALFHNLTFKEAYLITGVLSEPLARSASPEAFRDYFGRSRKMIQQYTRHPGTTRLYESCTSCGDLLEDARREERRRNTKRKVPKKGKWES